MTENNLITSRFNNAHDIVTSELRGIAVTFLVSILSLLSILLIIVVDKIPSVWIWSLGILFIFLFPGHTILKIYPNENRTEFPIELLRTIGLSIVLVVITTFVLGLLKAIQLLYLMLIIVFITFAATLADLWQKKSQYRIILRILRKRSVTHLCIRNIVKSSNWILIILFLINVIFRTWLAISNGIWRDGPFHAMIAQKIVNERGLVSYSPFNVVNITENGKTYWPTAYPLAYHLLLAIMYMLGGEKGMLFLSPLLSSFSVLGVYIIAKRFFGNKLGILAVAFFSTDIVVGFVSASVYMDILILFFTILAIIEFESLVNSKMKFSPVLTGLWIGMLTSIKQTGILTALSLIAYGIILSLFALKIKKDTQKLKQILKSIVIAILMAFPFLLYQFLTFGSLLYPPFTAPFMNEKWIIDPKSATYLQRFQPEYVKPIYDILYETFLYPFPLTISGVIASALLGILALIGFFYTIKNRRKPHLIELFVLSISSLVFIILFRLVIPRYFLFLRIFSAIYVIQGIKQTQEFLTIPKVFQRTNHNFPTRNRYKNVISFLFMILICFSLLYQIAVEIDIRNASDRIGERVIRGRIVAYQQAGKWVQDNTPPNVLILGGRAHEIAYYTQRDTLWIFWFGAHNIPKIFHARTAQEALIYLASYKIDYIWLDRLQVANGFYELIPLHGLNDIIGFSPFFEKVFENNITRIFRVNYAPQSAYSFFTKTHYYGTILGGPLDFEIYQIIKLNDPNTWIKNGEGGGRKLSSDMEGFVEVQVDPTEFDLMEGNISSIPASITFYYLDTFEGTVKISILDSDGQYQNLLEITGKKSGLIQKITTNHTGMFISHIWRKEIYGEKIVSGSIVYKVQTGHNSEFPLIGALFIPGEVDLESIPDIETEDIPQKKPIIML